ncbi:hypothetical protein [Vulcanisaeta souniana]|uniref:hypothetical protein n=1 Tax=Vulcanisaeta souniana TaxID=164452 RepID=UPI001FB3A0E7|nr:hypothetical protein [Vulcanisaeta souniana]
MRNRGEVLKISFSAFFADLGYQTAVVMFPLVFVIILGAPPVWLYGVAEAVNYGLGSLIGFLGGLLGDVYGRKRIAVIGNAVITVVALLGFSRYWWEAWLIFLVGWWTRNLRTRQGGPCSVRSRSLGGKGVRPLGFSTHST